MLRTKAGAERVCLTSCISLKYNAGTNLFQEIFPYPDWGAPGAIGSTTPNTASFTAISLSSSLTVASGGTGQSSLAAHRVLVGAGTSGIVSVAPSSTSGYPLVSNGSSSDPSFGPLNLSTGVTNVLPLANGGTGSSSFAAHGLLVGEGASPITSISPSSTSGYPLLSNGSSSDPSFAQLNLSTSVTGSLPTTNGGTGLSSSGSANQVLGVQNSGSGLEYKSIVGGANVTVTNTAGQITIASTGGGSSSFPLENQCRIYPVSNSPFADTDTSSPPAGSQTLYFGSYGQGNSVFLYNTSTSTWQRLAVSSQASVSLSTLTANTTYDVYVYNNSGTPSIEFSAWNYGSSPPYPNRYILDGTIVKQSDYSRLYVGTIEVFSNSLSQISVASYPGYRGVWNAYNRIQSPIAANDVGATSWAGTSSWRIANGRSDTAYGSAVIRIVTGEQIEAIALSRYVKAEPTSYTASASFGIAVDSGSSTPTPITEGTIFATSYTIAGVVSSSLPYATTQLGAHVYESIEVTSGGANFFSYISSSGSKIPLSGMSGTTWC